MEGYSTKRFGGCTARIGRDIGGCMDDRRWGELCDALFAGRAGTVLKQGAYKTILACTVGATACLVKVYTTPGVWKLIRSMVSQSRAAREFDSACYVVQKGIPAPRALFMAERRRLGCVTRSLVGIEYLSGARELRDLLFQKNALSDAERAALARNFGRMAARIFAGGVYQYDLSLNNVMARRADDGFELYLIDYERVEPGRVLSHDEKLRLLAKLNRVGCEVRLSERLRFLQGYGGPDAGRQQLRALACEVQRHTIRHLQQDLRRGRLTSLYTHGEYDRIKQAGVAGLLRKGYVAGELLAALKQRAGGAAAGQAVAARCDGLERRLRVLCFSRGEASRVWAACSAFRIAGLPLELPHGLIEETAQSMLLVPEGWLESLKRLLALPSKMSTFLRQHFPRAFSELHEL